jgi:pyruvate dehydrogenase E2 component (dihydrolipoamide acetyltransferase)
VELAGVAAAHPGETIRVGLVERFAATAAPAARPPAAARAEARGPGLQRAVGRLMERSKREIPHYYLAEDIDMGRALAWMEACNTARSVKERLLPAALLLRAVVLATSEVPEVNGTYVDGVFHHTDAVHLGIAVSQRRGGLIAPVIRDAHTLSLHRLMALMLEVVGRARSGALRSSDVDSATITVTNLGDQGVDGVWGVIIPPQVAIVGFGRIRERPWAEHGMLAARPVVTASLSGDHRVSHGHRGARFLGAVARALENPEVLA